MGRWKKRARREQTMSGEVGKYCANRPQQQTQPNTSAVTPEQIPSHTQKSRPRKQKTKPTNNHTITRKHTAAESIKYNRGAVN